MKFDTALTQSGIGATSFSIPLSKGPANTKYVHFQNFESEYVILHFEVFTCQFHNLSRKL